MTPPPASTGPTAPLSPSELRALQAYVATGSVKEAARLLGRSHDTIRNELRSARLRTGLTTERLIYEGTLAGWLRVRERVD